MPSNAFSDLLFRLRRGMSTTLARALIGLVILGQVTSETHAETIGSTGDRIAYAMNGDAWVMAPPVGWGGNVPGSASFARDEGIPTGTMTLNDGIAIATAASFAEGQIDLDIKPLGYSDAGIVFHRRATDEGEFVYIRANPDCPAAQDCVQYAPITHGLMAWNIYPNYQASAPITATGWNHLTIQIAQGRMRVYLNHATEPSLEVAHLLGSANMGGIALKGPAMYANLVLKPHALPDLSKMSVPQRAPGTVTYWLAAPPTPFDRTRAISATSIPPTGVWRPIEAEQNGLVNLGRAFGPLPGPVLSIGWLKTVVEAKEATHVMMHIGFAMQLSVFVNGALIYRGNNPYYPEASRLSPGGRIDMDNAVLPLPVKVGRNEIVLAIGNDWRADLPSPRPSHYGWAAEAFFEHNRAIDDDRTSLQR